jgi:acetyl-CoA carboxylase biotin carboxyl carrier protein
VNLTYEDVQEIVRLLDASSFDELHLETDRFKLTLRRSGAEGWTQETRTLSTSRVDVPAANDTAPASSTTSSANGSVAIRTPIVGTFHRAPKPDAPPFVEVGSKVEADTVIGIVETMKLMNSVHAGASGEVTEICAQNGQFVAQGQVVMLLRQDTP